MSPDEFRALGHRMVDRIAEYMRTVEDKPVRPAGTPGDVLGSLPQSPPEAPQHWDDIIADLDSIILPNLTHWQHPGFFAYFPCNASGPGIMGEIAAAGLNVNGMLWATSPAATELETRVLDWCAELFGLPHAFRGNGVIQGTASESTLIALLAARARARRRGLPDAQHCLITSDQAHSSVIKAAMIAGLARGPDDRERVRLIATNADGSMDRADLRRTLETLFANKDARPIMVAATAGTTGTGGFDDAGAIADEFDRVSRARDGAPWSGWAHLDAAWAGAAAVCPEHRGVLAGAARADSICLNPHKWLLTNFDCDLFWVRHRDDLTRALSITPEYLRNPQTDAGAVIDYRDWQIPLGRRFRALKLWFVLRHYGARGLRDHIRRHVAWAEWLEQRLAEDRRFVLVSPRSLALVCFRLAGGDDATRDLLDRVNATGEVLLSHTRAPRDGGFTVRVAIGATATEFRHVARLWDLLHAAAPAE